MKNILLFITLAETLMLADSASARVGRIFAVNMSDYFRNDHPSVNVRASFAASNLDVYRVYARGSGPFTITDVFGEVGMKMEVTNHTSGTFFNVTDTDGMGNTIHYDTAPKSQSQFPPGLFDLYPERAYDTYASIGLVEAPDSGDATTFTPGFIESANHFQTSWKSYNAPGHAGGWSVSGFPQQADATQGAPPGFPTPSNNYYLFLLQFAVPHEDYVEGRFAVTQTGNAGCTVFYGGRAVWATHLPAPGSVVLLGVAAIGARRRRRNAC